MKKIQLTTVGLIMILALAAFTVSCKKDKDDKKELLGCKCTEFYFGSGSIYTYDLMDMRYDYDADDCSTLARNIVNYDYYGMGQVSCTEEYR